MNKLPFIIPESEINLRLARLIIIIEILGLTKRGKHVMTFDKLAIFDFLLRNPSHLYEAMKLYGNNNMFDLNEEESSSIDSLFPNRNSLYDYQTIKSLIQLMILSELIMVHFNKTGEIFFEISNKGKEFVGQLESSYLIRIKELSKVMLPLQGLSTPQLNKIIKTLKIGV